MLSLTALSYARSFSAQLIDDRESFVMKRLCISSSASVGITAGTTASSRFTASNVRSATSSCLISMKADNFIDSPRHPAGSWLKPPVLSIIDKRSPRTCVNYPGDDRLADLNLTDLVR